MPNGPGALDALINEAQIYGQQQEDEVMDLFVSGPGGGTILEFTNNNYTLKMIASHWKGIQTQQNLFTVLFH